MPNFFEAFMHVHEASHCSSNRTDAGQFNRFDLSYRSNDKVHERLSYFTLDACRSPTYINRAAACAACDDLPIMH
jgi:hypothetical protein